MKALYATILAVILGSGCASAPRCPPTRVEEFREIFAVSVRRDGEVHLFPSTVSLVEQLCHLDIPRIYAFEVRSHARRLLATCRDGNFELVSPQDPRAFPRCFPNCY